MKMQAKHIREIVTDQGRYYLMDNGCICLLLEVRHGKLLLLHLGGSVTEWDIPVLSRREGLGWGCSTLYAQEDPMGCLDSLPLAWSEPGIGDFRDMPVELSAGGHPLAADFTFSSAEVTKGPVAMAGALPQAHGDCESLLITLCAPGMDGQEGLTLELIFSLYETALVRRSVLHNGLSRAVTVQRLMSSLVDLPGRFTITTLDGGWIAETHAHTVPVGNAMVVNASTTGFSSNRHNPGFLLEEENAGEDHGRVYGFNLVYSGNHYASAQLSLQGYTRVVQGISPDHFSWELPAGETFEAPEAVIAYSDAGRNGLRARMHRFINEHIVPAAWCYRERPVLYNDWEGCMFSFTEGKLLSLAGKAKELGCELFVLDDGWFGSRDSDKAGLGDYAVNKKKLPHGLEGLSKELRSKGLSFGLWFEPEAVNPDSDLYRAHPEWALHGENGRDLLGRNELLLDLRLPAVQEYIVSNVGSIIDSAGLSYVKWDMNRHSPLLGADAHRYILGLYGCLGRIFGPRPDVLLESCASGGNRFDLGMLCHSPQIWGSDDTDPIERLDIQDGLFMLYPQSCVGAHISAAPHAQTLRQTPLYTRANVAFFGAFGLEMDLKYLLPVEQEQVKNEIAFYKENRKLLQFGTLRKNRTSDADAVCWQVTAGNRGTEEDPVAIVGLFHRLQHAAPGEERLFAGVEDGLYSVKSLSQLLRVGEFGPLVKHIAPIPINPNGIILRTADRLYRMEDGGEDFTASARALQEGVPLLPRFAGTGYDKQMRAQGDFGSNMYIVTRHVPAEETDSRKELPEGGAAELPGKRLPE